MTCEEIARESGIPKSSVHRIVTEYLQKRKVSAQWVPHIAQSVKDVMADYKWEVLPHPAYSPDMSPPNYDLFPKLKNPL
jgi:hypothetical protein